MCDICVMNAVKDKMLSRRSFFRAGAAGVAAVAAGAMTTGTAALAAGHAEVLDMTHELHPDFPTYFGAPGFAQKQVFNWTEHKFNLFELTVNEHTGTHIDAPLHFSEDGLSVNEIPVSSLIAPLCVIDIKARATNDPDTRLTPDDLKAWISANGEIPPNACVALNSGWGARAATAAFRM